jgi:Rha family phage regulatory protein
MKEASCELGVFTKEGRASVSARSVAKAFGKERFAALRTIRRLNCSKEFNQCSFACVDCIDEKGGPRPEAVATKGGFAFLAMGFTGKEAARFKEACVNAFNKMEAYIRERGGVMAAKKNRGCGIEKRKKLKGVVKDRLNRSEIELEALIDSAVLARALSTGGIMKPRTKAEWRRTAESAISAVGGEALSGWGSIARAEVKEKASRVFEAGIAGPKEEALLVQKGI